MTSALAPLVAALKYRAMRLDRFGVGRWIVDDLVYRVERLLDHSDELTPPRALRNQVGPFDDARHYRQIGRNVFDCFITVCALRPDDDVLDLGCGCGQMAAPLSGYLTADARYEGFDIGEEMIAWCRRNITSRRPNFRFRALDIHNAYFRPHGLLRAAELVFPYDDAAFDFVFAKSLFTHLLPADVENYVAQTARVLRPGGRVWLSFFLLDEGARARIAAGRSTLDFRHRGDGLWTVAGQPLEYGVARADSDVVAMLERHGLALAQPITYGSWSGRPSAGYQDFIFAVRR